MGAVFLREALAGDRPSIGDGHDVHGAVADVAQHIDAFEIGQVADDSGETLGEHVHVGDVDAIFLSFEGKHDLFTGVLLHEILLKSSFCSATQVRGKPTAR